MSWSKYGNWLVIGGLQPTRRICGEAFLWYDTKFRACKNTESATSIARKEHVNPRQLRLKSQRTKVRRLLPA